jgi:serine/threonine-protein kinase
MESIGEYLVKRLVGEGGMGKVYEAEERLSKRRVALKVLRPELARNEEGRRLFLNEMQILAHLEHPSIVRSLASMEVDGQLVMALEFLEGRTLRAELNERRKIPWHEAVTIVTKIAEALAAAHAQEPPIVHRDLKPENVMLLQGAALKVMDFGIAKVLAAAHATNTQSIGTLQYMSPEQIDAQAIDARSDLYSLGLILYEMVSGSPPFHSASPRELLNMQCTLAPPELSDEALAGMPSGVEELLFQLLEKSPDARPKSASEVLERLAPFRPRAGRTAPASVREPAPPPAAPDNLDPPKTNTAKKPLDTVALVEQATAPRRVPTMLAVIVIIALSIAAGLSVYVARLRAGMAEPPTAKTAARSPG